MVTLDNKMTNLGDALKDVFQDLGLEKELFRARVLSEWQKIVGKNISDRVKPVRFDSDFLILSSESSVWKNEIILRKSELIDKINSRLKAKVVLDIRFK
jgi:predicted nucleic acid-binding Zn ribbon protein